MVGRPLNSVCRGLIIESFLGISKTGEGNGHDYAFVSGELKSQRPED